MWYVVPPHPNIILHIAPGHGQETVRSVKNPIHVLEIHSGCEVLFHKGAVRETLGPPPRPLVTSDSIPTRVGEQKTPTDVIKPQIRCVSRLSRGPGEFCLPGESVDNAGLAAVGRTHQAHLWVRLQSAREVFQGGAAFHELDATSVDGGGEVDDFALA